MPERGIILYGTPIEDPDEGQAYEGETTEAAQDSPEPIEGSLEWCQHSEDHRHCVCWWDGGLCCLCGASNGADEEV